ncbi:MAG: hypothetical protein LH481_01495 [Burkholderiales bacterium]|nr:hypothetical protein [Burkholderiales bacterium]
MLTFAIEKNSLVTMSDGLPDEQYHPIGALRFYSITSDEEFAFTQDAKGQVSELVAKKNGRERKAARLGPLMHNLKPQTDPNPARTEMLKQALFACGQGGTAVANSADFAASTKTAFGNRALPECVGVNAVAFLHEQDVSDRAVERHASKVSKVLFYKMAVNRPEQFLLIYLDHAGRIADLDTVAD